MELISEIVIQLVFWFSLAGIVHTYAVYPFLMSKVVKGKDGRTKYREEEEDWPMVHVAVVF